LPNLSPAFLIHALPGEVGSIQDVLAPFVNLDDGGSDGDDDGNKHGKLYEHFWIPDDVVILGRAMALVNDIRVLTSKNEINVRGLRAVISTTTVMKSERWVATSQPDSSR
jgi:hypothetical protein